MFNKQILQIEAYGDFDVPVTAALFEIDTGIYPKQLLEDFVAQAGITPMRYSPKFMEEHGIKEQPQLKVTKSGIDGLSDRDAGAANVLFIEWLKKRGFSQISPKVVTI